MGKREENIQIIREIIVLTVIIHISCDHTYIRIIRYMIIKIFIRILLLLLYQLSLQIVIY